MFSSPPERERTHDFSSANGSFVSLLCHAFYHIRDEHEALHILRGESRAIFIDYLMRRFSEIIGEMQLAMEDAIPRTYVINQLSSNFASSLEWWIADDMRTTPECLAGYFMAVSGHLIYDASLLAKNKQTMETAMQLDANKDLTSLGQEEQKVSQIREQVAEYEKTKDQIHEMLKLIGEERDRITIELSKAQERLFQEEAKLGQIDVNVEAMKEKIFEDYELTYNTALALKDENYDNQEGQKRISELKKSISALGYVNVNAIEDSKILEESYNEYVEKMEDLTKTESDILSIIKDLSEQMTAKFEAEFEQINNNFTKIFRELFNGGNARLVLTDSDDILTAGIDIIAEPPGKKLQNLSLLSGGEKALTAIAILFAILKLRPMPFCLLDEIEAALDDANVERFAKYLHRFAQETQFIVITHRKPTMELADSLFGVTMEEKGVSKIVSIKLSDAIKATEAK